jgi:hypothetical protein
MVKKEKNTKAIKKTTKKESKTNKNKQKIINTLKDIHLVYDIGNNKVGLAQFIADENGNSSDKVEYIKDITDEFSKVSLSISNRTNVGYPIILQGSSSSSNVYAAFFKTEDNISILHVTDAIHKLNSSNNNDDDDTE